MQTKNLSDSNRLTKRYPKVVREWHPSNNHPPSDYSYGSTKVVRWICYKCCHSWLARISCRTTYGAGCPKCSKISAGKKIGARCAFKLTLAEIYKLLEMRDNGKNNTELARYIGCQPSTMKGFMADIDKIRQLKPHEGAEYHRLATKRIRDADI